MTKLLTIERLTPDTAPVANELDHLFDDETCWSVEQGNHFLTNHDNLFLLARWNGIPCGFLTAHRLQRFDLRRAEVLLYELGVDEAFRRRGIASQLIEAAKHWAKEQDADQLWVLTEPDNEPALATYTKAEVSDRAASIMLTFDIE